MGLQGSMDSLIGINEQMMMAVNIQPFVDVL